MTATHAERDGVRARPRVRASLQIYIRYPPTAGVRASQRVERRKLGIQPSAAVATALEDAEAGGLASPSGGAEGLSRRARSGR